METIRWVSAGLLSFIAIYMVVLGFVRQIHNLRESRKENSCWSSPTPLIGTVAFLGAWALAPTSFPSWGLLFLLLDIDTLIVLISLPLGMLANDNE
jgi:uncharacterized membrane protein HdeD (DUF308 family)